MFESLEANINQFLSPLSQSLTAAMQLAILDLAWVAFAVSLVLTVIDHVVSDKSFKGKVLFKYLKMALIIVVATSGTAYNAVVFDGAKDFRDSLASLGSRASVDVNPNFVFSQGAQQTPQSIPKQADKMFKDITEPAIQTVKGLSAFQLLLGMAKDSLFVIKAFIFVGCAYVSAVAVSLCVFIPWFMASLTFTILVGVGPLFILAAAFGPTKRFFDQWLTFLLGSIFIMLFLGIALSIIPSFFKLVMQDLSSKFSGNWASFLSGNGNFEVNFIADGISLVVLAGIASYVALKSSFFAAQLVGGSDAGNPTSAIVSSVVRGAAAIATGGKSEAMQQGAGGSIGAVLGKISKAGSNTNRPEKNRLK